MRWPLLREALQSNALQWRQGFIATLFFGVLAILGTHSGVVLDMEHHNILNWRQIQQMGLQKSQASVSFRYPILMVAGLTCGPWCGFGAGVLSGIDRYFVGGEPARALGAAVATLLLGLGSGFAKRYWQQYGGSMKGTLIVILLGTVLEKIVLILFTFNSSYESTINLYKATLIPSTLSNIFGALLLLSIMKVLERERLESAAELRALQAQVEPHFLYNTLNAIKGLITKDPIKAKNSIVSLSKFFRTTHPYAAVSSITLKKEIEHLHQYLELQKLCLSDSLSLEFSQEISSDLLAYYIPARSIETLAENVFTHGLLGKNGLLKLSVVTKNIGKMMEISISDNGCGIAPERLAILGTQTVSSRTGSGSALHLLSQCLASIFYTNAKLDIYSQEGKGTRIVLTLPKRSKPW